MSERAALRRLVTFGVGDAWYAADIAYVERVLRHEAVQPVPNMPPWMEGVIEHQGRFVPVVDLRRRFGVGAPLAGAPVGAPEDLPAPLHSGTGRPAHGASGRLLLLSVGDDVIAAAVDRVVDVRAVADGEIAPPPRLVRGATGEFLKGMVRREALMVLVLDVPRLLSPDEHRALDVCVSEGGAAGMAGGDAEPVVAAGPLADD